MDIKGVSVSIGQKQINMESQSLLWIDINQYYDFSTRKRSHKMGDIARRNE